MAVCMGSDLAKDMAGEALLRGVSFKVGRHERPTLSGRNGSGKTTLLRMIAGETSVDGGELVLAKGTRVALHDQRPPRERNLSLRDYVLSGSADLVALERELARLEQRMADGDRSVRVYLRGGRVVLFALERELARLEQRMADGDHDQATLDAYSRAQA